MLAVVSWGRLHWRGTIVTRRMSGQDVRVVPLCYPARGQLRQRRVGWARIWRPRMHWGCGRSHRVGYGGEYGGVKNKAVGRSEEDCRKEGYGRE
jgi:hypothetical protein